MTVRIALVGDFKQAAIAHQAIPKALNIAADCIGAIIEYDWIGTKRLDGDAQRILDGYDGIWCVPASP